MTPIALLYSSFGVAKVTNIKVFIYAKKNEILSKIESVGLVRI